jgi:ATP-binding cassette subfamily C protein
MQKKLGADELRSAMKECRRHFFHVGIFSVFVNMLMLTGPLFMLQVYDRVLSSRSEPTLLALLVLVTVLFLFMGLLDYVRGRVLSRAGAKFQSLLDERVFTAVMRRSVSPQERAKPNTGSRDLDSIKTLLSGPAPFAVFDIPWVPIYMAAIFLFHPILGWVAVAGGAILVVLSIINQLRSSKPGAESVVATSEAENFSEQLRQNAEAVQGLGMMGAGLSRWQQMRAKALDSQLLASDRTASYTASGKSLRFYLQSFMLAAGAYLVLQQELTPGMMIAGSILMGRALAPIEQAIGQWQLMQRAAKGWSSLGELLERTPIEAEKTKLPAPKGHVQCQGVTVLAPGERVPAIRGVQFEISPGHALGVIGPSGAGKTTLAKALVGIWPPMQGKVRIDGAALDQWNSDELGRHIGYLPQDMGLLSGTVAQNIARLSPEPDDEKVIEAAKRAGAHDLLLSLPQGYDTEIGAGGQKLSGGQRQRVALARALYGDPPVIVLDEPNANLDSQGEQALVEAIRDARSRGRTVIIMAHRPSAIAACDLLLMLDKGAQVDFGPRDDVLKKRTKNYAQLTGQQGGGQQGGGKGGAQAALPPGAATAAAPAQTPGPATSATGKPAAGQPATTAPAGGAGAAGTAPSGGSSEAAPAQGQSREESRRARRAAARAAGQTTTSLPGGAQQASASLSAPVGGTLSQLGLLGGSGRKPDADADAGDTASKAETRATGAAGAPGAGGQVPAGPSPSAQTAPADATEPAEAASQAPATGGERPTMAAAPRAERPGKPAIRPLFNKTAPDDTGKEDPT